MEKESRGTNQTRGATGRHFGDSDFVLQWGSRKRLRCVKIHVKSPEKASTSAAAATTRAHRRTVKSDKETSAAALRRASNSHRILRNSEAMRSPQRHVNGRLASAAEATKNGEEDGNKGGLAAGADGTTTLPRFEISLSNKEKEEDFMIFKGCSKLPQRPKKRAKSIQRTVNLVCPGTWLCDLTQERYEVREKKVSKKRPRGLKAMGSIESDSD